MRNTKENPYDPPTPEQVELFGWLVEELGEAGHATGKLLRHGATIRNPFEPEGPNNRERLEKEFGDVLAAINYLGVNGQIDANNVYEHMRKKVEQVQSWLHGDYTIPSFEEEN